MSFESGKPGTAIPSSFSSPEFAGPGAHDASVMSTDSTMDSIATNVSSSITESRIVKSANSNTHDSGFGDSLAEDASLAGRKLVARAEHSITVSGPVDISLVTRIEGRDKARLKSVEEDMDVKQTDDQVITIVKTTKLTTKVERVNKKKRKNSKKSRDSKSSEADSGDDTNNNQSESLVYQVDINKSTEELVYETPAAKRKLELKADSPVSPSKHFKPAAAKQYTVHKYELLSAQEKERVLYMKEKCVDMVIGRVVGLEKAENVREMVSRSLDLLRHDRIESFDKLAQEMGREYNAANGSVFNGQMKKLIVDEKILMDMELDKSGGPCEELIEFGMEKERGANFDLISANLIKVKESESSDEAGSREMREEVNEKCGTPPSTPQNELGCGDGAPLIADDLNRQILKSGALEPTSVQTPTRPKRSSTLSSCFTCAGVLKLSDDESRPQQQMDRKKVVETRPHGLEVAAASSPSAHTIVHTTLITHDLDKRPTQPNSVDSVDQAHKLGQEKFIALDTDDSVSVAQKNQENDTENVEHVEEKISEDKCDIGEEREQVDGGEVVQESEVVGEEVEQASKSEVPAKKSKNKKKKKKKKNKSLVNGDQSEINENVEQVQHETTPEDDAESKKDQKDLEEPVDEQNEDLENKVNEQQSNEINNVHQKESIEEVVEIKVDIEPRENEIKDPLDQVNGQDLTKHTDTQLEVDCQRETNIQVIETLRVITERVIQESQPAKPPQDHQVDHQVDQQIEIVKEKLCSDNDVELYKPAIVQQNDPVVLPEPTQKVMSLTVDNVQVETSSSEPAAVVKEAESEEDGSKISCFSCRGKKAAKKSKGPKQPIKTAPAPATTEFLPAKNQPIIEPRPVDVSFFVGLDNTDNKLDSQSLSSGYKKQTAQAKEEIESSIVPNITPSLIGSTSIEQPGTIGVDTEVKIENDAEMETKKDVVVEVIYESKQEEPNENLDQVQMEDLATKPNDQILEGEADDEPIVIEIEKVDEVKHLNEGVEEQRTLSDDPVVLPDPSERPIAEIVEATPLIQPSSSSSSQPIEQTPKLSAKKNNLACCGGKKRKSKKSKKTSKIDLPIVKILAPKQKQSDAIKVEEKTQPEQTAEAIDSHELARVQKAPPKDWAKGLDRTQSTELIRREPQVSDVKITDNLGEQLTNVTIEVAPNVDMQEIYITKSESVKISEPELVQTVDDARTTPVDAGHEDIEVQILPTGQVEDRVISEEMGAHGDVESDAKVETKELSVKTNLTFESPGAIIRINREADHAVIPDHTKDRVIESVVDESEAKEQTATDSHSSKATGKKSKNKKTKRTSRIDLPLINILVPKQDKTPVEQVEPNRTPNNVRIEQSVTKVVNLGNDLDTKLVEKDTTIDINIPSECELKNVDINLKIDTAETKQLPEINIAVSQYTEHTELSENVQTQTGNEMEQELIDSQHPEIFESTEQIKDSKVEEKMEQIDVILPPLDITLPDHEIEQAKQPKTEDKHKEKNIDVILPPLDITVPDIKKIDHEIEQAKEPEIEDEDREEKIDVIVPPLDITVPDIKRIDHEIEQAKEPENKVENKEEKIDVILPPLDFSVPDIKKLAHEPDVVVLPEVDLSGRVQQIEKIEQPLESSEIKVVESKKSKKKKNRTSKIDLPLVDIFSVKEAEKQSAKTDTNIYVDMPVVDLVHGSDTTRTKNKKEPVSCFACRSKKSKKNKQKLQPEKSTKQIPKIVEPVENEQEINEAIEVVGKNIDQAETSNLTDIIKEAEKINEINVKPLIVIDYNETTHLQTKEDVTKKDVEQVQHETHPENDAETKDDQKDLEEPVDEQNEDLENKVNEQQSNEINNAHQKESIEEVAEIMVDIEPRENEIKDPLDQENGQDLTKYTDTQLEVDCQRETNIQVIETLRVITERVIQESQPAKPPQDHQVDQHIDQQIEIVKEKLCADNDAELYKPAIVQQNDPVVLPEPRQKVMSLTVDNVQVETSSNEPAAVVKEAESEEDGSKISCFSCRGKKAAKKSKGPKQPLTKPDEPRAENVPTGINLTPQIKSVNLDLFKGLDKPSSLSEMEKAIDYSDLSVVPRTTIVEKQNEENAQQVPQSIQIELPSDLTSAIDLPPSTPTKDQIAQVKSEMEQMLEPAPVPQTQIPTIKINQTFDSIDSPPLDLATPPKKPPRGHLDTSVLDEPEHPVDQTTKMNVKEALVKVNTPGETPKSNDTPTRRQKKHKTSIIDLPLIDILVPKESKKTKVSDNAAHHLHIEPKGTSIELNQPEVELFIERGNACSKQTLEAINLSSEDKKLLKAKRNEICEYLKQRSGYKLEQLAQSTSQTSSKKELKAKEKMADKLYKRSIKLITKTRVKPISFSELSGKLEKVVSAKSGAGDIEKCVGQIRSELESDTLFSCLREKSEKVVEKREENVKVVDEPEVECQESEESKAEPAESRKSSLGSEIMLPCPNLSWREANERARILFYKGQTPSIHYNEKRDSFQVSRLVNSSGKEKVCQVPVTDDDVKKLLNSYGLYWNGESIDLLDKSDQIFTSAQQEAFDILNSIQVSESIQITQNHCETVEQSKINYIY
ncbi:hypothetical protein BpHYR1_014174 [Brachionus plicatilis]|uniref:Uncharacterized protein n=1 Tax=Brachionus plicatilis TaxID=10195 RepID=A0A3M7SFV8_BRAPC|nr:hypothetical protein BpHYR1_014174 [Brachionus plicatilis]